MVCCGDVLTNAECCTGERNTSNPISDAEACRQLYEETFKIVAERAPAIKKYYMDEATVEA